MKTLISTLLIAMLAACAPCEDLEPTPAGAPSVEPVPAPVVEPVPVPSPTPAPSPAPAPAPAPTTPEPILACPQNSTTACGPSPYPAPIRPIVIDPNPTPTCVRNADPLVYIAPHWVDNCGNKYGTVGV